MTQFKNGDSITTANLNDNELELMTVQKGTYPHFTAFIEILQVGGTGIQFSSGEETNSNSRKYLAGEKLIMTFLPSLKQLHYKSDDITDIFSITL